MARTITATLTMSLSVQDRETNNLADQRADFDWKKPLTYISGTGVTGTTPALQLNELYQAQLSIAASSSATLDLSGSLTGNLGHTVSFTKVKVIIIELLSDDDLGSTNASSITIGNAASNQFVAPFGSTTDKLNIDKGGALVLLTGTTTAYAVANSSTDKLKVLNNDGANAANYRIILLGNA